MITKNQLRMANAILEEQNAALRSQVEKLKREKEQLEMKLYKPTRSGYKFKGWDRRGNTIIVDDRNDMKGEKKMTNFEYYKDEILKISKKNEHISVIKNVPEVCSLTSCKDCDIRSNNCRYERFNWLYAEHVEKPKLTKHERMFCELLNDTSYNWIARDLNNKLCAYKFRPGKYNTNWFHENPCSMKDIGAIIHECAPFNFIKWEDEDPWSIGRLLSLEVEE